MRGLLITCEGPEGSGKSTHSKRLVDRLRAHGVAVLHTREPGGTPTGEAIRQLLQHDGAGESPVSAAEVLLFCASRAQLIARVIAPALARGTWVVCDRFTDSTLAYQGYGRGFDLATLRTLNAFATDGMVPDLTLLFDVDTPTGFTRVHTRVDAAGASQADRFERESADFHEHIRRGFLELASCEPARFRVFDSTQPMDTVSLQVWGAVQPIFPRRTSSERELIMHVDAAFDCMRHAFASGRMPHGLIITGDIRRGADELASRILQMLFCRDETSPCGTCPRCMKVRAQTTFDVVWIAPEKKSRQISIEQIRERLLSAIGQTTLEGGWKAGVIVGADRMNAAAANAFLKTLEEPPPQTLFLLLTDSPQNLLPTILSRCQRIDIDHDVHPLDAVWRDDLVKILAAALPPGPISALATSAQISALLSVMQEEAEVRVKAEAKIETGVDDSDDVLSARISARYRELRQALLIALQNWHRDVLVLRSGGAADLLQYPESLDVLRARAAGLTIGQALANVATVDGIQRQLERNLSEDHVLAYWMDRIVTGAQTEKRT